ncbi:MAG TPA: tyrosine-protein phosphatase [bacterium]|nr:tyrosine-protein phosphatase [bacterium]
MNRIFRRFLRPAAFLLTAIILSLSGAFLQIRSTGNFQTVIQGCLYRSGQLSAGQLETRIRQCGLKSVVNLRGRNETSGWWRQETELCRRLGVAHLDFTLSSRKPAGPEQLDRLAELLRSAPKPALVHCQGGADRTGLAAAVYVYEVEGLDYERARRQLAARYGHLPFFKPGSFAMDRSFEAFRRHRERG